MISNILRLVGFEFSTTSAGLSVRSASPQSSWQARIVPLFRTAPKSSKVTCSFSKTSRDAGLYKWKAGVSLNQTPTLGIQKHGLCQRGNISGCLMHCRGLFFFSCQTTWWLEQANPSPEWSYHHIFESLSGGSTLSVWVHVLQIGPFPVYGNEAEFSLAVTKVVKAPFI